VLAAEAAALEAAGAELLVLCTNTMHKLADSSDRTHLVVNITGKPHRDATSLRQVSRR
jgi:aspartate/glutamate racemase